MSDDRLPTATMAEYLRAEANLAATPTTALAGAVFAAGRAELLRQAADRLEELTAAVDAARAEERERCLQTIRDYAAECRVMAAESWTQGESLKYLLKAETAEALAYALRLKEPTP